MRIFFALVLFCVGIGHLCANISSATIDSDNAEIMKLSRDFNSILPPIVYRMINATCDMVSQCCPELRSQFMTFAMSDKSEALAEKCFGTKNSTGFLLKVLSCRPIVTMITLALDRRLAKYAIISRKRVLDDKELLESMIHACSSEDLLSIVCKWDNNDKEEKCNRKVLEKWAEQGDDKMYTDKVAHMKHKQKEYYDDVKKLFGV